MLRSRRNLRRVLRALAWAPPVLFLQPVLMFLGARRQRRGLALLREWGERAGFRESLSSSGLGTFAGEQNGRAVVVTLKARPSAAALFGTNRRITIAEARGRPDPDREFESGHEEFDDLYRTRLGSPVEADAVRARPELADATLAFYGEWLGSLRSLRVLPCGVQADLLADEFHPRIDVDVIEGLLPELARLATAWDEALPPGEDPIDPSRFERAPTP